MQVYVLNYCNSSDETKQLYLYISISIYLYIDISIYSYIYIVIYSDICTYLYIYSSTYSYVHIFMYRNSFSMRRRSLFKIPHKRGSYSRKQCNLIITVFIYLVICVFI